LKQLDSSASPGPYPGFAGMTKKQKSEFFRVHQFWVSKKAEKFFAPSGITALTAGSIAWV
jgi:hypothetical protein